MYEALQAAGCNCTFSPVEGDHFIIAKVLLDGQIFQWHRMQCNTACTKTRHRTAGGKYIGVGVVGVCAYSPMPAARCRQAVFPDSRWLRQMALFLPNYHLPAECHATGNASC
jgi:hypothetical protein